MVTTMPITPWTAPIARRGNSVKLIAWVIGIIAPPMKPWMARSTISCSMLLASAQPRLASVKPAQEMTKATRVESQRISTPDSGIMMISATR